MEFIRNPILSKNIQELVSPIFLQILIQSLKSILFSLKILQFFQIQEAHFCQSQIFRCSLMNLHAPYFENLHFAKCLYCFQKCCLNFSQYLYVCLIDCQFSFEFQFFLFHFHTQFLLLKYLFLYHHDLLTFSDLLIFIYLIQNFNHFIFKMIHSNFSIFSILSVFFFNSYYQFFLLHSSSIYYFKQETEIYFCFMSFLNQFISHFYFFN